MWLFLAFVFSGNVKLVSELKLEPLPGEAGFMESIRGAIRGEQDRFYLVDNRAKCLFVYHADGSFWRKTGQSGSGPGEFEFFQPYYVYLAFDGELVYVVDSGAKVVHAFRDGEFLHRKSFLTPGRMMALAQLDEGRFAAIHEVASEEKSLVMLYDRDWQPIKTLMTLPEQKWRKDADGLYTFHAYLPRPMIEPGAEGRELIMGFTDEPVFTVCDFDGEPLRDIRFAMMSREVTPEDKLAWVGENRYKVRYPEKHPIYWDVIWLSSGHYLVYYQASGDTVVEGILVDEKGRTLGDFQRSFARSGGMIPFDGKIFVVDADDDIELFLATVALEPGKNGQVAAD